MRLGRASEDSPEAFTRMGRRMNPINCVLAVFSLWDAVDKTHHGDNNELACHRW